MFTLPELAALAARQGPAHPVAPLTVRGRRFDLDAHPAIMGVVNLSRDSTYRDSVAVSPASALRRARIMTAQGATFVDVGAESSTARAVRVDAQHQISLLLPVVRELTSAEIVTSVESYEPTVVGAALKAGASLVNLTGSRHESEIFELVAAHEAAVVVCFSPGGDVREIRDFPIGSDPVPYLLEHFGRRLEGARAHGVEQIAIDPGLGFFYGNMVDPLIRVREQARMLLNAPRLRVLGVPLCQAMPHAFELFEEEFRVAEGFFAVLSALAGNNIYRTHETSHVAAMLRAIRTLNDSGLE